MSNNLILNSLNKPVPQLKSLKCIHFRAKTTNDWNKFLLLIKDEFNINLDLIKPKIEKLDELKTFDKWLPEFKYCDDNWEYIKIYCLDTQDKNKLSKILNIKISDTEKSIWYPIRPDLGSKELYWKSDFKNSKYPIYIISKGRYLPERRYTQKHMKSMTDDYYLVVEENEYNLYLENGVPEKNLLMFTNKDIKYFTTGDFEGHGGSIPVRNFIWQHSIKNGFKRHWCIDDNIDGFFRFNDNKRIKLRCMGGFRAVEYFADKYNVPMAGMNYNSFCPEIAKTREEIYLNTRVYSIILLDNNANKMMNQEFNLKSYLWRGKYNEDTDLSLRLLKSGRPTALFNSFLGNKMTTMSVKGGNTSSIYQQDGLQKKLDSLIEQHPDVVKGTFRFKKTHHLVNYKPYKDNKAVISDTSIKPLKFNFKLYSDDSIIKSKKKQKEYSNCTENINKISNLNTTIETKKNDANLDKNKIEDIFNYIQEQKLTDEDKKKLICLIAMS